MGFVTLFTAIAINLILRVRIPPRKSGPLADWRAFTEIPYIFFVIGFFLIYWAVYFAFYYVSTFKLGLCVDRVVDVKHRLILTAIRMRVSLLLIR